MANEQLSPLPPVSTHITGHNSAGKAVIHATRPATWKAFDDNTMAFNQIYTTDFPADLNENRDIVAHDRVIKEGNLGLVKAGGTVCRQVSIVSTKVIPKKGGPEASSHPPKPSYHAKVMTPDQHL